MKTYIETINNQEYIVKITMDDWGIVDFKVYQMRPRRWFKGMKKVLFCSGYCLDNIKENVIKTIANTLMANERFEQTLAEFEELE